MSASESVDPRTELAEIAASLRAYLEWQQDSGAVGIPRGKRPAAVAHAPREENRQDASAAEPAPIMRESGSSVLHPGDPSVLAVPSPSSPSAAPPVKSAPERLVRLEQIRAEVTNCTKCALATTRTNTVFSRGNPESQLCFIGEAPGADEDAQGLPFVGRAGQLLDKMIGAMGLAPERDVYVCNIIKCRPPGNRRPSPEESDTCIPYLHEQLALVRPRVIVAMGNTAVAALLQTTMGITKLRGQWKLYRGSTLVMPTYHPSYLLRPSPQQQQAKREAWEDLQVVMKELGITLPAKRG